MQWGMIPPFHRAVCDLRPVGKSLGLKSGKAHNEHMFYGLLPKRPCSASSDLGVIAAVLPGRARRLALLASLWRPVRVALRLDDIEQTPCFVKWRAQGAQLAVLLLQLDVLLDERAQLVLHL